MEDVAFVLLAKMSDPLTWGMLAGGLVLGGARQPWWSALLLAIGSVICEIALLLLEQQKTSILTLRPWLSDVGFLLILSDTYCGTGWVLGLSLSRLVRAATPTQS